MKWIRLAAVGVCLAALSGFAQDPAKVDPQHYKVESENELLRILRMKRGPREKVPMHEHTTPYVVVFLTDVHQNIIGADNKKVEMSRKADDVSYFEPTKHAEESLSDQPMEAILVELKAPALTPGKKFPPALDSVKIDPKHMKVESENNLVRILRVRRGAHEGSPMHQHPADVAVFMSDIHQNVTAAGGTPREVTRKRGEVSVNKPGQHEEVSLLDKPMHSIIIELKSDAAAAP